MREERMQEGEDEEKVIVERSMADARNGGVGVAALNFRSTFVTTSTPTKGTRPRDSCGSRVVVLGMFLIPGSARTPTSPPTTARKEMKKAEPQEVGVAYRILQSGYAATSTSAGRHMEVEGFADGVGVAIGMVTTR